MTSAELHRADNEIKDLRIKSLFAAIRGDEDASNFYRLQASCRADQLEKKFISILVRQVLSDYWH